MLHNLQPEEILHIGKCEEVKRSAKCVVNHDVAAGDDVRNDYLGPRHLGWNSLLVDRWGGGYDTVPGADVVSELGEIFKLL